MKRIKQKKLEKKINTLYQYIQAFNSPLAPRGDGARFEAGKEFHDNIIDLCNIILNADLNEDTETLNCISLLLLELVERSGLDLIDMEPEIYYMED